MLPWQPAAAQTQSRIEFSVVNVSLYPEFNHPTMLVMVEIKLAEDTPTPIELSLQIPLNTQLIAITNQGTNADLIPLEYEINEISQFTEVTVTSTTSKIRLEYIDNNFFKQEDFRYFEYQWFSKYPVKTLSVTIRQPFGVNDIKADPPLDEAVLRPDNNLYYTKDLDAVPGNKSVSLTLFYRKDPGNDTFPSFIVDSAVAINEATPGRTPPPLSVIMWLVAVAVAVLIMVGIYYWWFRINVLGQQDRLVQGVGIMNPEKQVIYCHECGMRSRSGDSYCSNCGTELRKPARFDGSRVNRG